MVDIQMDILELTETGIYIIDKNTYELYYCNRQGFRFKNLDMGDFAGKKCYEYIYNRMSPCENCPYKLFTLHGKNVFTDTFSKREFSINVKDTIWNGRDAVIIYLTDNTDARRMEKQLARSEELAEAASSYAGMWMWTYDIQNNAAHCYRKLREEFNLPETLEDYPESWLSKNYVLPEYQDIYRSNVLKIKNGELHTEFDCKMATLDGIEHWIRCRFNVVEFENEMPSVAICTSQSIDFEKELESRIELEQQKPFVNQDTLVAYIESNLSQNKLLKYKLMRSAVTFSTGNETYTESVKRTLECIADENDRLLFAQKHDMEYLMNFYKQGGTSDTMEFRRIIGNGEAKWVRNTMDILMNPATGDIYLYEYAYDIDNEKKDQIAMDCLLEQEIEFTVRVNVKSGMGHIIQAKESINMARYIDEFDYENVARSLIIDRVDTDERKACIDFLEIDTLIKTLETEKHASITYKYKEVDGCALRKKIQAFYLDASKKDIVISRMDITDLYNEEQLQKAKLKQAVEAANMANSAKSDFLAQMSHDIRTPMNAIIGLTSLAFDEAENPEAVRENLKKINSSGKFLLGLINDILDMSKIESGNVELRIEPYSYMDFISNIQTMFVPLCEQKGLKFEFEEVTTSLTVLTDRIRLNQIFFNIISNAVKYTPSGGTVSYRTENIEVHPGTVACDYVISDTGIGMSEEFQKVMFQAFVQEDTSITAELKGTGLGLSIAKTLIELMGGTISVKSKKNVGTTVTIHMSFNTTEEENTVKEQIAVKPEASLNGKHILLVEDHPLNMEIAVRLLQKKGIIVTQAENGRAAVDIFESMADKYFDMILMDVRMPVMNGLEAAKEIRSIEKDYSKNIPIIAMTANAYDSDREACYEAGMNDHIAKPVDAAVLYNSILKYL